MCSSCHSYNTNTRDGSKYGPWRRREAWLDGFFLFLKIKNEKLNKKTRCKPVHEIIKMGMVTENVDMQRGLKVQPKPKDKGVNMDLHECKQQRTRQNARRRCQMFRFCRGQVELRVKRSQDWRGWNPEIKSRPKERWLKEEDVKILIWRRNNLLYADSSVFLWNEAEDSSIIETTLFLLKSPKPFEYGRLSHYSGNMLGGLIQATAAGSA